MIWTIYCHMHVASGRRYIGLTRKTMMHRWNRHVFDAVKRGLTTHFANAIRKYGKDAFSHEALAQSQTLEGANETEQWLIDHYSARDPRFGFNLTKGGDGNPV
jgi:hypothetical protein